MGMEVRFWGVRGSCPCATSEHIRYGGDTSCVSVESQGHFLVFDAGSGIRGAGLYATRKEYAHTHLFLSHMHIDHILGLPFYAPLWLREAKIDIYASHLEKYEGIEKTLRKTFEAPVFPVPFQKLPSAIKYVDFKAGEDHIDLGGNQIQVRTANLNHPNGATGYRVTSEGVSVCYVTDTEHSADGLDPNILNLIEGADMVIYDASYTDEEYPAKVSWGHSTWQEGIRLCQSAGAKALCIYHHDPSHTDDVMDGIAEKARAVWEGAFIAKQGMVITL